MPSLTIKNLPDELYDELKQAAEQEHRSINSEVIVRLKRSLFPEKASPVAKLEKIRAIRSQIKPGILNEDEIEQAINEGRL